MNDTPIFEFRGPWDVPVHIGSSLIMLFLAIVMLGGGISSGTDLAYALTFFAILILSIYLHELGHAWGCLIQGVPVRRVMLYGGGGFCEHARSTSAYEDELIVAMGPIVNLAIWAITSMIAPSFAGTSAGWVLETAAYLNLFLAIFNLMPVMPLDGGRLFHLLLLRLMPAPVAMQVAGGVGLAIAIAWIPLMILAFVYVGFILLFFPPIGVHWRMLTKQTV